MSFLFSRLGRRANPQGGFGSTRSRSADATNAATGEPVGQNADAAKPKRIFDKDDGEYVDFEEIE